MFSFRRKPKKEPDSPRIRTSPSLPELNSQGIPWPEELVDIQAIRQEQPSPDGLGTSHQRRAATQDSSPRTFHKPFRQQAGKTEDGGPISSIYMAGPAPTFDKHTLPPLASRISQRRARIPPTFNLMVVGGKGTGKTSLLRLLLETADTSPTATADQKAAVERFLKGSTKTTQSIQTACVEICESRFDRVLFCVIDTPGLDFSEGRELKLERQVNNVIKYVDMQYADTMNEESKVVRQSKGDQHIHLCIYMVDPASIMTAVARRGSSSIPTKTRSETTVSMRTPPDLVPDTSSGDETDDEDDEGPLTMAPAEIRVIQRLSARTNVLPVIARADSLTDEKLTAVKEAVRTGLAEANIDLGVFGPAKKADGADVTPKRRTHFSDAGENGNVDAIPELPEGAESDEEEERKSRPVIKLRPPRHRALSRSRSRRDLSRAAGDERTPDSPDENDRESVANVRFSAHIVAKTDLSALMPFALITPEHKKHRARRSSMNSSAVNSPLSPTQIASPSEDEHTTNTTESVSEKSPSVHGAQRNFNFLHGPPEPLRNVFIRQFRWGTIDVLNPDHCDFAALRTTVLSTHLKLLKIRTKEVLYERYRTEKLLARRATSNITDEERERLLEGS
ncbi:septin family protein [Agrocybe pediades]|nr:septin family protein [Agrocybe pediades]